MIAWAAQNMLWATAAMLLVLAIRRPVARWCGAGAAYALWLVPPLRLVAPPGLPAWFDTGLSPLPPLVLFDGPASGGAPLPLDSGPGQWVPILLAVWAGGALLFTAWQFASYRAFLGRISESIESAGSHGGLPVMKSGEVDGPLALGLIEPRIVVPADFQTRYSAAEQALALDHEHHHHRRRDLLANHAALLVLAIHWFNPIAWAAFRAFRADQELSCDAAVLRHSSPADRLHYAQALIKSASRPGLISACPLNHADQLKRRLKMMNMHRSSPLRRIGGGTAIALVVVASAGIGTAGAAQEQGQRRVVDPAKQGNIIIMQRGAGADPAAGLQLRVRDGRVELPENCPQGEEAANFTQGSGETRSRVLFCTSGDRTPEQRVQALERVRDQMASSNSITAEARQRVLQALEQELQRLRSR